jgi:Tfp pilus assembly protein PilZ
MKASDRFFVEGVPCGLHGKQLPVANLSVGGFFAATDQPPALGQLVDMELTLGTRAAFRFTGKVSWVNEQTHPKPTELPRGFGVKILRIDFPDKLAIVDHLKRILHDEEGGAGHQSR